MSYRITAMSAALVLSIAAQAQSAPAKTDTHTQAVVLKAARLFDGRSGKLSEPGLVVVNGERIVAVGAHAAIPADDRIVDLGDATLLPGFIDAHTHITQDHNDNWA